MARQPSGRAGLSYSGVDAPLHRLKHAPGTALKGLSWLFDGFPLSSSRNRGLQHSGTATNIASEILQQGRRAAMDRTRWLRECPRAVGVLPPASPCRACALTGCPPPTPQCWRWPWWQWHAPPPPRPPALRAHSWMRSRPCWRVTSVSPHTRPLHWLAEPRPLTAAAMPARPPPLVPRPADELRNNRQADCSPPDFVQNAAEQGCSPLLHGVGGRRRGVRSWGGVQGARAGPAAPRPGPTGPA